MFSKSTLQNLTAGKTPIGFGKWRLLQVDDEQPSVNSSGVISLRLVSELIKHLFMIKISVTLNEGQGQYN